MNICILRAYTYIHICIHSMHAKWKMRRIWNKPTTLIQRQRRDFIYSFSVWYVFSCVCVCVRKSFMLYHISVFMAHEKLKNFSKLSTADKQHFRWTNILRNEKFHKYYYINKYNLLKCNAACGGQHVCEPNNQLNTKVSFRYKYIEKRSRAPARSCIARAHKQPP